MSEMSVLKRHSLWMISGHGVAIAFQAAYFILIGRALGSREYGAFVGVAALINVLSQCSSLGMEMILVRNVSRDRNLFAVTWGAALRITAYGFIALLAVAMLLGHFTLKPELRLLIPYVALSDGLFGKIVQLASRAFQGAGYLEKTAQLTALTNFARALAALFLFLAAWFLHQHSDVYLWTRIYWVSSLVTSVIAGTWVTRKLGWPAFAKIRTKELLDGCSFSLSSSSISIYNDIDKTVLAGTGQIYAAGIYAAAYRIVDVASIPIYAIYTAASPQFFRDGQAGVDGVLPLARRLLKRTVPYGILFALVLFAASPAVPYLFGPSFRETSAVLRWLCLLPLIRGLHYAWGTAITGSSSQWYRTSTQVGAALLNLALNLMLIPHWSWRGAAAASLLTDGCLAASSWLVLWWLRTRAQRPEPRVSTQAA